MKRIQSKKHKLGTYGIDKISLSCFDDKRYVLKKNVIKKIVIKKIGINEKKVMIIEKDCDN